MAKEERGAGYKAELARLKKEVADAQALFNKMNADKSKQGLSDAALKRGDDLKSDLGDPAIRAAKAGYSSVSEQEVAEGTAYPPSHQPLLPGPLAHTEPWLGKITEDVEITDPTPPGMEAVQTRADGSTRYEPIGEPEPVGTAIGGTPVLPPRTLEADFEAMASTYDPPAQEPSAAKVIEDATGQKSTRMGGAWRNLPEDLRPEQLAGGLVIYPFERREYEARIQQAVQDGTVSPKVAKQVMAGYDKWKRTAWGAMVDYSRLKREEKHIGMEADADKNIIEERRAQQDEKMYAELETAQREAQEAYEAERATYQESMAETMAAQEAAIENLARMEIDPERWWNSKSNGRKVMSAIGVALGSLGSGLTGIYGRGTPNVAYDIMKSAINRDVTAQMADMRNRRASVGARQSLLGTIMSQVKDAATAQSLARMVLLDQAKSKISMYAAGAQGDSARRNAEMLIGLVDNDREILWAELRMNAHKLSAARSAKVKRKVASQGRVMITRDLADRYIRGVGIVTGGTTPQFKEYMFARDRLATGKRTVKLIKRYLRDGYSVSLTRQMLAQAIGNTFVNTEIKALTGVATNPEELKRFAAGGLSPEGTAILDGLKVWRKTPAGETIIPLDGHLIQKQNAVNQLGKKFGLMEGTVKWSPTGHGTGKFTKEKHYEPYFVATPGTGKPFAVQTDEHGKPLGVHVGLGQVPVPAP